MSERSDLVVDCRANAAKLSKCDLRECGAKLSVKRPQALNLSDQKIREERIFDEKSFFPRCRIVRGMIALGVATVLVIVVGFLANGCLTSEADNNVGNYFERPENNRFQLNILPEYEVERYVFPAIVPNSPDEVVDNDAGYGDATILYRIPGGPKSPRAIGKRPSLIQHGILCDKDPCVVNKPQIAIVYLLVDQGYDVWLGISNSSMAENSISSEKIERKRLEYAAECILTSTNQTELLVMGYFNGSVQFFGMSAPPVVTEQSKISKWLEYIPGVKTAKRWYRKGKNYLTRSYDKVIESFDRLGKNVDYIIDDPSITNLKNTVMKAWGIVVTMVAPTLTIKDFSKMINHPDVYLNTPQLITKYGYDSEVHQVKTADGYLLSVHRISGSKNHPPRTGKPVVYLQHGILSSSAVWVLMGPSKALGYLLADEGYDVWMGNSRGNTYSRAHVNMSTTETKFWDFSFHEMGIYDLPATIDHIIERTGQKKIHYVGHSQGTTSFFAMLSEKPEYNDKIIKFAAYAPIVYTNNVRSPIVYLFAKISAPIYQALQFLNINDFLPTNALLTKIGREVCEARTVYQVVCSNALFMVTGYDSAQMNKTIVPIIMGHLPAGSSVKQFLHYGQEFNSNNERRGSRQPSSRNRERSRSRRRENCDYDRYDSRGSPSRSYKREYDYDRYESRESRRRHYNDGGCDIQGDEHGIYHDEDKYSEHSAFSNYRRERGRSPTKRQSSSNLLSNARVSHTSVSHSVESLGEKEKENNEIDEGTQPNIEEMTKGIGSTSAVATVAVDKSANTEKSAVTNVPNEVQETELEADVLEVFGERSRPDRVLAQPVHSHLTSIWYEIIEKGLPAEERKTLLKKFPPPKNCVLIDPPKLNLEVKAALDSTIQKRDERIVEKQEKIAASLAGVGKTIELLLKSNPSEKKQYLEPLTGISRLLADLQHDETSIRRSLILKNIKAPFKDTLKDLSSDEWLFGKDINEKLKAAKVLQQSSKDLKPSIKQSSDQGKNSKNSRGPPHQNHYKSNPYSRGGGYRPNYGRGNSYSRGNKSTSRGRSHYQKTEQTSAKKTN